VGGGRGAHHVPGALALFGERGGVPLPLRRQGRRRAAGRTNPRLAPLTMQSLQEMARPIRHLISSAVRCARPCISLCSSACVLEACTAAASSRFAAAALASATYRGAWARVTTGRFRHLAPQTFERHRVF
jgi:hypothetical protein